MLVSVRQGLILDIEVCSHEGVVKAIFSRWPKCWVNYKHKLQEVSESQMVTAALLALEDLI